MLEETFHGVRFVLLGFEPNDENEVRSKLVNGGGVEVSRYDKNCTHVIVNKLVYDDPACVAARRDGKILVTSIWVDRSYDIGVLDDATSVVNRPLKDLNGIPGAQSFIMCLTGYQRHDRDYIMTLVSLMGAQFSKPLVANKVTHLICYKFDGEKYELAKKMKKIKLVNHQWLEDCLKAWEILPEANYNKSGYELEMEMEDEAKDSEDEAVDIAKRPMGMNIPRAHELPISVGKVLNSVLDSTTLNGPSNDVNDIDILLSTGKDTRSDQASNLYIGNKKHPEAFGHQNIGVVEDATFGEPSNTCVRTPISKVTDDLAFTLRSAKKSPHSDVAKFSAASYSTKNPKRSTLQEEILNNASSSPRVQKGEFGVDAEFPFSPSKVELAKDGVGFASVKTPLKGTSSLHENEFNGISPLKRKMDASCASSKLQTSRDSKPCISGNPSSINRIHGLEPTDLFNAPVESNSRLFLGNNCSSLDETSGVHSVEKSPANIFRTKSSNSNKKSLTSDLSITKTATTGIGQDGAVDEAPQASFEKMEGSGLARKSDMVDFGFGRQVCEAGEREKPQDLEQDVEMSSSNTKKPETEKLNDPTNLDSIKGGNDKPLSKPLRKKTIAKKSLGSRPKYGTCNTVYRKGSIQFDRTVAQNDAAGLSIGGNKTDNIEKSGISNMLEAPPSTVNVESVTEMQIENVITSGNGIENEIKFMDDETEAPEDEVDCQMNDAVNEKSEMIRLAPKADEVMEEKSQGGRILANNTKANIVHIITSEEGKSTPELQKETGLVESTLAVEAVDRIITKGKKRTLGKRIHKADVIVEEKSKAGRNNADIEQAMASEEDKNGLEPPKATCGKEINQGESVFKTDVVTGKMTKEKRRGKLMHKADAPVIEKSEGEQKNVDIKQVMASEEGKNRPELQKTTSGKELELGEPTFKTDAVSMQPAKGRKRTLNKVTQKADATVIEKSAGVQKNVDIEQDMASEEGKNRPELQKASSGKELELDEPTFKTNAVSVQSAKGKKRTLGKVTQKADATVMEKSAGVQKNVDIEQDMASEEGRNRFELQKATSGKELGLSEPTSKSDAASVKPAKGKKRTLGKVTQKADATVVEKSAGVQNTNIEQEMESEEGKNGFELQKEFKVGEPTIKTDAVSGKLTKGKKRTLGKLTQKADPIVVEKSEGVQNITNNTKASIDHAMALEDGINRSKLRNASCDLKIDLGESTIKGDAASGKATKGKKRTFAKTQNKTVSGAEKNMESKRGLDEEESEEKTSSKKTNVEEETVPRSTAKIRSSTVLVNKLENSMEVEKENKPMTGGNKKKLGVGKSKQHAQKTVVKSETTPMKQIKRKAGEIDSDSKQAGRVLKRVKTDPTLFILSGHRLQRKEFQKIIKSLKGRFCRDSHHWTYQATHFIVPDPIRRTEKFFAAVASGRWILKMDYLTDSSQAGKFLPEQPYEWHKKGLNEDGAINLEAPRKWRLLRERTGHGAFYGMRIIIYGECIAPPLDTLKRAVKAGDGTILATSPPYTRFLNSGVDFAIVSPGMPRVDMWVQEFLNHEIPCVVPDYLVEYACKPGYSLEKHVQYNTQAWAEKSVARLLDRSEEIVEDLLSDRDSGGQSDDLTCQVCGSSDRGEVMLICGDEKGCVGCGAGTHIDCCDPPLDEVPEGDWFCLKCSRSRKTPKSSGKKRSVLRSK